MNPALHAPRHLPVAQLTARLDRQTCARPDSHVAWAPSVSLHRFVEDNLVCRGRNGCRAGPGLAVFCNAVFLLGWILDRTNLVPSILVRALAVVGEHFGTCAWVGESRGRKKCS